MSHSSADACSSANALGDGSACSGFPSTRVSLALHRMGGDASRRAMKDATPPPLCPRTHSRHFGFIPGPGIEIESLTTGNRSRQFCGRSHFNSLRTKASVKSVICTDHMDLKSKSCQDLNNQLAIYQAFRNTHGVAAVLRQMANEHCPIQKVVIR